MGVQTILEQRRRKTGAGALVAEQEKQRERPVGLVFVTGVMGALSLLAATWSPESGAPSPATSKPASITRGTLGRVMLSARFLLLALLLPVAPTLAYAAGNPADEARLEYLRGPGAESCPGEEGLRDGVAAQMGGADPFTARGSKRVVVTIGRAPRSFEGEFALYNAEGALVGRRPMSGATCADLVQSLATSLSLALRPFLLPSPPIAVASAPPLSSGPEPFVPPIEKVASTRPDIRIGVGASMGFGLSPAIVSPGFGGSVGVRWPWFSLSLEGRGDLPASTDGQSIAHLQTSLAAGTLAPCFHGRWLLGCGLFTVGAVHGAGLKVHPEGQTAPYVAAGLRAGFEAQFSDHFAGQLVGDALLTAVRPRMLVGGNEEWIAPFASGSLGIRLVASF